MFAGLIVMLIKLCIKERKGVSWEHLINVNILRSYPSSSIFFFFTVLHIFGVALYFQNKPKRLKFGQNYF
jgi:hypothetical protein